MDERTERQWLNAGMIFGFVCGIITGAALMYLWMVRHSP